MNHLFVCRHNLARSSMAEVFFRYYSLRSNLHNNYVKSAGVDVISQGEQVPISIALVMQEKNLDLSYHRTMQLKEEHIEWADKIYVLCKTSLCQDFLKYSEKAEFWRIKDPIHRKNQIIDVRDELEYRIKDLLKKLK